MQITSVDLENIKSYRRERILLTPGLNAVCGLNGGGKTTILEAIGFALFDYLPYSHQAFLREGEKTGTVRVQLQAGDGREYEVVRKVGGSSQYFVVDVESGTRLAERRESVLDWMRTHALGMDRDADLEALFKNAVGVPQGLMTSDFLNAAGPRKKIFDPLLRVEEYERAWADLRETVSTIQLQTKTIGVEIARLEVEVDKIPGLVEQENALEEGIRQSESAIARIAMELEQVRGQTEILDGLEQHVMSLRQDLRMRESEVQRHNDMGRVHQERLDAAVQARAIVDASEHGYQAVEAARRALGALEERRKERDKLDQQETRTIADMEGVQNHINHLDAERQKAISDGDAAAALTDAVARQIELETSWQEVRMRIAEGKKLDADLARLDGEIRQLEQLIARRDRRIEEARQAQAEVTRLDEVRAQRQDAVGQLQAIESMKPQLRDIRAEGDRLRKQHDALRADADRCQVLRQDIEERRPMVDDLEVVRQRERELREERIRAQATLDYQNVARADLERESCPLLDLRCPVVASDRAVLAGFDDRVTALARRLEEIDTELVTSQARLTAAGIAEEELHRLEVEVARLETSETRLPEITENLVRCREQYQELSRVVAGAAEIEQTTRRLDAEIKRLENAGELAAQLAVFEEQQDRDRAGLEARRGERRRAGEDRERVAAVEAEAGRLQSELQRLGDPRKRQTELLATAKKRPEMEAQIEREQERLQATADRLRALVAALQQYSGLDEQIEEHRRTEAAHRDEYERYLEHREEAGQIEVRREALEATERALAQARDAERQTREALAQAETAYDGDLHTVLKGRHGEIKEELGAETQRRDGLGARRSDVQRDLEYYRRQEEKLLAQRSQQDELERTERVMRFIRDTIRAAGPAITETLLANISQIANDIYAEIMDDHAAELRWDREYEVLVRRGPEDRRFVQLSGGEQMSAALAVRLALLKEMSEVDVAFFDEPTQNMDADRRDNLAGQIGQIRGFNQLIVISHDDTFEHHTDNLIRLAKEEDETRVEAS